MFRTEYLLFTVMYILNTNYTFQLSSVQSDVIVDYFEIVLPCETLHTCVHPHANEYLFVAF